MLGINDSVTLANKQVDRIEHPWKHFFSFGSNKTSMSSTNKNDVITSSTIVPNCGYVNVGFNDTEKQETKKKKKKTSTTTATTTSIKFKKFYVHISSSLHYLELYNNEKERHTSTKPMYRWHLSELVLSEEPSIESRRNSAIEIGTPDMGVMIFRFNKEKKKEEWMKSLRSYILSAKNKKFVPIMSATSTASISGDMIVGASSTTTSSGISLPGYAQKRARNIKNANDSLFCDNSDTTSDGTTSSDNLVMFQDKKVGEEVKETLDELKSLSNLTKSIALNLHDQIHKNHAQLSKTEEIVEEVSEKVMTTTKRTKHAAA